NYPPDYGIASGATFSLALKSGTQKFHGEAWEFFRNNDLDANDYFNKYQRASAADFTPVPELRQNIFGFNLGGPLTIPHGFNKSRQKTFFFYNQEWRRVIQTSPPTTSTTMPNADRPVAGQDLQYVAPAYATSQVIYVPTAAQVPDPAFAAKLTAAGLAGSRGAPFPNQIIPASLFDPNAVLYLGPKTSLLPYANVQGDKATTEIA